MFPRFHLSASAARPPLVRERKYVSDRAGAAATRALVSAWAAPDPDFPEGELESVYFDTPDLAAARAKADGDSLKRKVRIRWYRGAATGRRRTAWLEIKDRIGSARDKARHACECSADFLDSAPLRDPAWTKLLRDLAAKAGFPVGHGLFPMLSIAYRRYRFMCPETGSRISVDWALRCPRANPDFLPFAREVASPAVVVEAKSADVWHWPFGPALEGAGFRIESFSKYGLFTERLKQGAFR